MGRKRKVQQADGLAGAAATKRSRGSSGGGAAAAAPSPPPDREAIVSAIAGAYGGVDGYAIAREERQRLREAGSIAGTESIGYGEIDVGSFLTVLDAAAPADGERFLDIGSGTGKAVVLAAAAFPVASSVGIELLKPMHASAVRGLEACHASAVLGPALGERGRVELMEGDCLDHTAAIAAADVLFAPCTCFTDEMMTALLAAVGSMKAGARVICTSRPFKVKGLRKRFDQRVKYARGSLRFLVYEKQ